jgi:hypothetical protein
VRRKVSAPCSCWAFQLREQSSPRLGRLVQSGSVRCIFAILTKWFSSTRLETRTKESNIYASIWVVNPGA